MEQRAKVDRKLKNSGHRFHQLTELLLYSKIASLTLVGMETTASNKKARRGEEDRKDLDKPVHPSHARKVWVDPGKHNIVTMVCKERLRYTFMQRVFESGLTRYKTVLHRVKMKCGIERAKTELSMFSHGTKQAVPKECLKAEARSNASTRDFLIAEGVAELALPHFLLEKQ
jgi:hypothetical protein